MIAIGKKERVTFSVSEIVRTEDEVSERVRDYCLLKKDGSPRSPKQIEVLELLAAAKLPISTADLNSFIPGASAAAAVLLKKAVGIESGSGVPNKTKVGKIARAKVKEIAELKMKDLNANDVDAAMRMIEGTARSMGLDVVD